MHEFSSTGLTQSPLQLDWPGPSAGVVLHHSIDAAQVVGAAGRAHFVIVGCVIRRHGGRRRSGLPIKTIRGYREEVFATLSRIRTLKAKEIPLQNGRQNRIQWNSTTLPHGHRPAPVERCRRRCTHDHGTGSPAACSRVTWVGPTNQVITGRSMDWPYGFNSHFHVIPRGERVVGAGGLNSLSWTSRHGTVMVSGSTTPGGPIDAVFDGMTNSPIYSEQLKLNAYWQTRGRNQELPGSIQSPDRFVRGSYYVQQLPPSPDPGQALAGVMSVMRNISVPWGTPDPEHPKFSPTWWRSLIDQTNQVYYFDSALSHQMVWVNLKQIDFKPGSGIRAIKIKGNDALQGNVTNQL